MKKLIIACCAILMGLAGQSCTDQCATKKDSTCKMNVASFNLRCDVKADSLNAWPHRKEYVKNLIRFYDFDMFGTQEGFKHQIDGICELEGYTYIGGGREDGKDKGEHAAIIYQKDRFDLLDKGDFWFSETPEVPGLGWDAKCCFRICSWGKFRDKETGKEFVFINSHFDHEGVVARRESSKLLLSRIRQIAGENMTVFATGDFNAVPDDEPIVTLASDGLLLDSYKISKEPPFGTVGTYNGWSATMERDVRIDYIWVTKDVTVEKYGVLNVVQYGRTPSDHFPIMSKVSF